MIVPRKKIIAERNASGPHFCVDHSTKANLVWDDNPQLGQILKNLAKMGLSDAQVAQSLGITPQKLAKSLANHPEIEADVLMGRSEATRNVIESAYKLAMGQIVSKEYINKKGVKITEYFPPSAVMIKYWLNNRDPSNWGEKQADAPPKYPRKNVYNEADNITRLFGCLPEKDSCEPGGEPGLPGQTAQPADKGTECPQDVPGDVQGIPADNVQDDVLDVPDEERAK